ncbi:MAG: SPOR domain-containing protein [Pseudomonadota bacterium]
MMTGKNASVGRHLARAGLGAGLLLGLAACADEAYKIEPIPYVANDIDALSCSELLRERDAAEARAHTLYYVLRENAHTDQVRIGVGGLIGATFLRGENTIEAGEYARAQGKISALSDRLDAGSCLTASGNLRADRAHHIPGTAMAGGPVRGDVAVSRAETEPHAVPGADVATGRFLQVGTFAESGNAAEAAAVMARTGYGVREEIDGAGRSRVLVGPLATAFDVEQAMVQARALGLTDAMLVDG